MKSHTRKLTIGFVVLIVLALAAGAYVWSGLYNIGADDPHMRATYTLLETLRDRSIEARASQLTVPDLSDPAKITQGAGNYNAMCVGCHLAPGVSETELSKGLYPAPPNLGKELIESAHAFWVIKHGIKASGMPAWGKSMDDAFIWNMAAFLQKLPSLDAAQYQAMVGKSGGHSHGGGETGGHEHAHGDTMPGHDHADKEAGHSHESLDDGDHHDGESAHHPAESGDTHNDVQDDENPMDSHDHAPAQDQRGHAESAATTKMATHRHADGTVESHPVKPEPKESDDHDHQH